MAKTFSLSKFISNLLLIVSLTLVGVVLTQEGRSAFNSEQEVKLNSNDDLDEAASNQQAATTILSTNSHRVVAFGWPSTSQMWPTLQRADEKPDNITSYWTDLMEPFIYADRPRSGDYSLLLSLNQTVLNIVKSHLKPISVNLSFEYYFNYDQKITAPPGIKIEVDRKQLKYIEPNSESVKQRVWMKFNEAILMTDPSQFDNHDWLKLSLIIRQPLSLVALRHLKVEFRMERDRPSSLIVESSVTPQATTESAPPAASSPSSTTSAFTQAPTANQSPAENDANNIQQDVENAQNETIPAASNVVEDKVKPDKKHFPWNVIGRKKRETISSVNSTSDTTPELITLTCYQKDDCEWKSDLGPDQIQWSLARMPPSTEKVATGYYYVSNMNNYGDLESLLRVTLNQTDSATIADQNSDHCIELAMYITERSHVKMYQLQRHSIDDTAPWIRGNLLLTWAPTIALNSSGKLSRNSLPNSWLAAMENGHSGWTYETLCFGEFFSDPRKCGLGLCALAFEMVVDALKPSVDSLDQLDNQLEANLQLSLADQPESGAEQVVGISLLREFSSNIPFKTIHSKWLETWQREEIEPTDNWKFYPKLDYKIEKNNISLINLYDSAHYYIESDWMSIDTNQELTASLAIDLQGLNDSNALNFSLLTTEQEQTIDQLSIFILKINTNLVDANFSTITNDSSMIDWNIRNNNTLYNLSLPITDHISAAWQGKFMYDNHTPNLFKIIIEILLDTHLITVGSAIEKLLTANNLSYRITLANVSLSDRCFPNPCQHGACSQNGTGFENWNCNCEDRFRGRRCEFARWCNIPHITPWVAPDSKNAGSQQITLKAPTQLLRQPKMAIESVTRVSGREYCQRKLGSGSRCTDIDVPLNDNLYIEEDKTFICSCQDDYYLSDDSRCKQAHLCNSVLCPSIGMICDETKPFNRTQPCQCNEKQDWFPDPQDPINKCVRRQCHDKQRDCQFDAHICLPTLPGEKPICKCGPKFTLKEENGKKYCQSTACVLPTLNDCQQICKPENSNPEKPYRCECHRGFTLDADGRSCSVQRLHLPPHCKPSCNLETQICTDAGCKCKQGYIGEGEVKIRQSSKNRGQSGILANTTTDIIDYTQSIRCLNVCELTYAENKEEFELIESVCPLGLCDKTNFQCQCSDPSSSALINSKYEPIYTNSSIVQDAPVEVEEDPEKVGQRISPLCHLRRVCQPESSSFKICKSQGAICVPDYTKPAMFDCICPPSTDKKILGHGTSSEFICEPKCESKKNECLRRQAVCKLVDRDAVKCDCLPGLMFNKQDQKCYLAKYSYAFNIMLVNKYYEPGSRFYKIETLNKTEGAQLIDSTESDKKPSKLDPTELTHILPQYSQALVKPITRSNFITDYNRCNITQVIPKDVIEDPYEHNIESFLSYIEQCNDKIHENVKTFHLNSRLGEDLRQSLRQHIRDFTVTTSNSSCTELDDSLGMYLNCTVYLQSNEPIPASTVEFVLNDCDKNGHNEQYCWIKPRLLLKKLSQPSQITTKQTENSNQTQVIQNELNYRQIIPCEIDNFCGLEAISVRADDKTSLCSCKCPPEIEVVDVKDLEPRKHDDDLTKVLVKEICAPINHCGVNSTFCLAKVGSVCHYDIRKGSLCNCVYPSYEDNDGRCIEVTFSQLDSTLIVIIVMLGTGLIVSIAINLAVVAKSKSIFGRSKQYPLNEFPTSRTNNRSTGVPNPAFSND